MTSPCLHHIYSQNRVSVYISVCVIFVKKVWGKTGAIGGDVQSLRLKPMCIFVQEWQRRHVRRDLTSSSPELAFHLALGRQGMHMRTYTSKPWHTYACKCGLLPGLLINICIQSYFIISCVVSHSSLSVSFYLSNIHQFISCVWTLFVLLCTVCICVPMVNIFLGEKTKWVVRDLTTIPLRHVLTLASPSYTNKYLSTYTHMKAPRKQKWCNSRGRCKHQYNTGS